MELRHIVVMPASVHCALTGQVTVGVFRLCSVPLEKKVKTQIARAQGGVSSREWGGGGGAEGQVRRSANAPCVTAHTTNSSSDATSDNEKHQPDTAAWHLARREEWFVKYKAGQNYCPANVSLVVKANTVPFCFIWLRKSDRRD